MKPHYSRWTAWAWICSPALMVGMVLLLPTKSWAIPAFARMYGLQCNTCHSAFPALNDQGEEFRLSGYRRFSRGEVVPITPSLKIGERLELPAVFPASMSIDFGHNYRRITNRHGDGSKNASTDPEFRKSDTSFDLNGMDIHVGAPMGPHLSAFVSFPIAGTERPEFYNHDIRTKGIQSELGGPSVPDLAYIGVFDIFVKDLLNFKGGNYPLPVAFSPDPNRLSFFPYMVYDASALDIFTAQPYEKFRQVGAVDPGDLEDREFRLGESQIGLQVFGRVTPALHKIPGLYVDYNVGVTNGSNVNPDNNKTKDPFVRLAFTYPPMEHLSLRVGGFGYYSGNTLDSRVTIPGTGDQTNSGAGGVKYGNRVWRVGPDISLTLSAPFYAKLFSQVLFGRDNNLTGFGKAATWWGGFVQAEAKPLGDDAWPIIGYIRYDWIDADRYNDSGATITDRFGNTVTGIVGPVHPRLWDVVVGAQYYVYQNLKVTAEFRHGEKRLRPGTSSNPDVASVDQLRKTVEDAVMTGFKIAF